MYIVLDLLDLNISENDMKYNYNKNKIIFDKIYPIKELIFENNVSCIKWAINEEILNTSNVVINGNIVTFQDIHLRFLYLDSPNKIKRIQFRNEFTITEEFDIDNIFRRNNGWAGADGVFSHVYGSKVHWYFSDTLVGKVNEKTRQREEMIMVNNTIGVSQVETPFDITFMVNKNEHGEYTSYYIPEKEGYYWLQDGVYKDGFLYISVIRVRDDKEKWFEVLGSEMIKVKVNQDDTLDYHQYERFNTPTYFELNDQTYTFGAAMLNDVSRTGYYYMFGYDNSPNKNLYMLRVKDFEEAKSYEFYTNDGWSNQPLDFKVIGQNIANEMRVIYDEKYIISYTKNCSSETIEMASTLNLEEGFKDRKIIYQCKETVLDSSLITYNAKLHRFPLDEDYYYTYNVNTTVIENLIDADIYYPRWLRLKKESD